MAGKKEQEGAEEGINELQILEQNMQSLLMQKQNLQAQLIEAESALEELGKTDSAYKIVGSIMVAAKKEDLKKDLETKKETISLRIKSIEKQEERIRDKASKTQAEILEKMGKK